MNLPIHNKTRLYFSHRRVFYFCIDHRKSSLLPESNVQSHHKRKAHRKHYYAYI